MRASASILIVAVAGFGLAFPVLSKGKKLNTQELLKKHLASIGAPQFRAHRSSVRATGQGNLRVLVGTERKLEGKVELVAQGSGFRSSMVFDVSDYPSEEVAFDGEETYVNQLNPGERSIIGSFIYHYPEILSEGLLGGTLATGWPLLNFDQRKPKLKHNGLRRFGEQQLHEVEYRRRKGRKDIKVRMYFLPETFHHVSTVYRLVIPATLPQYTRGSTPASRAELSSSQVGTRVTLEEHFSDFRAVGGLAIPHAWKVRLTGEGPAEELAALGIVGASRDLAVLEWNIRFDELEFNVDLDDSEFKLY